MPIYAYRCTTCEHDFDRLQKLSDPDPEACPACGAATVKRQVTAPSFRLAGSGWYETDFKKDGDRKRNLVEGGEGAKPPAAESGDATSKKTDGGDAKPAANAGDKAAASKPAATGTTPATAPKPAAKPAGGDA